MTQIDVAMCMTSLGPSELKSCSLILAILDFRKMSNWHTLSLSKAHSPHGFWSISVFGYRLSNSFLTYWGWSKICLQKTFPSAFCWKSFVLIIKFHWCWFLKGQHRTLTHTCIIIFQWIRCQHLNDMIDFFFLITDLKSLTSYSKFVSENICLSI